jgi:hypothetical protein
MYSYVVLETDRMGAFHWTPMPLLCQQNHGTSITCLTAQIPNKEDHMICMYADLEYWYHHYSDEWHTNCLLNLEIKLLKLHIQYVPIRHILK